jgi:hypothetical protein
LVLHCVLLEQALTVANVLLFSMLLPYALKVFA